MRRVQGLLSGEGAFYVPPRRPFFTRTFLFFCFFLFCLQGTLCYGLPDAMLARPDDEFRARIPRAALRIASCVQFFLWIRGNAVRFFFWDFLSGNCPSSFCGFQSSVSLRFFFGDFFATNFGMGVRGFVGRSFWAQKCPFCVPKTAKRKVLLVLGFFFGVFFCYGAFFRRVCATNSVLSDCGVSLGLDVRFCMEFFMCIREFCLCRFRASGLVFPGPFLSSLLFLLLLPPFFSWGRPGFLFSSSVLFAVRTASSTKAGPALHCVVAFCLFFFFLFSLPGPAPLSLALSLPLSFSPSLSLACTSYFQ